MSEGVRPALTREQFADPIRAAEKFFGIVWDYDEKPGDCHLFDGYLYESDIPAVVALLLQRAGPDGKPLFTREHWTALMLAADGSYFDRDVAIEAVARLAALLPPEEP